jgi:anaerobic selenocysteine-containing dehydrogenase
MCPKGLAALQTLYDPDRIRGPLLRKGPRGAGVWESIDWDRAMSVVAERLRELRAAGHPERLVLVGGRQCDGLMRRLWGRFLEAFGSPNFIVTSSECEGRFSPQYLSQGIPGEAAYDIENTEYLLSFGASLLEAGPSPVRQLRAWSKHRHDHPGHRVKIVQVDTRQSLTALKADEWIPIRPGTDGALALGMAHVLVAEERHDKRFVASSTFGFEEWTDSAGRTHMGFRKILAEYKPEEVEKITGVPARTIRRLAREFSEHRPAIALPGDGLGRYSNGLWSRWAVYCLNALVGSVGRPGGILVPMAVPHVAWPPVARDAVARQTLAATRVDGAGLPGDPLSDSMPHALPAALQEGRPYPVEALFVYYANPVYYQPDLGPALAKVPFVVSFSPFMDETATMADLILPDHTFLERWQDHERLGPLAYPLLGVSAPATAPLYDTRHTGDVLLALARALGDPFKAAFPWKDFRDVLEASVKDLYSRTKPKILLEALDEPWYETFARGKRWDWESPWKDADDFWKRVLERGGWWDPEYPFGAATHLSRTPSRRFEFFSTRLRDALSARPAFSRPAASTGGAGEDRLVLPHWEPPHFGSDAGRFPFHLNVYRPMALGGGTTAQAPYLQELANPLLWEKWGSWVEIHPASARRLGISDGEVVWLESPAGKVKVRARLTPAALPDVANLPMGGGHTAGGRYAKGRGVNSVLLQAREVVTLTGMPAWAATRVRIVKS